MFQDAAWCLVQSSDPDNRSQVNSCQIALATGKQPERPLRAEELSDFFREFRKHQRLNERIHLCNKAQTHVFRIELGRGGERIQRGQSGGNWDEYAITQGGWLPPPCFSPSSPGAEVFNTRLGKVVQDGSH